MNPRDLLIALGLACTLSCNLMSLTAAGTLVLAAHNAGLVGALLILAVAYRQKPAPTTWEPRGKAALAVSAAAMVAGILPVLGWTSGALSQLLGVFSGAGTAWILYGWFTVFTAMHAKRALCLFLGSMGTASLLRLGLHAVFESAPGPTGALLVGLAAFSTAVLWWSASWGVGPSSLDASPLVAPSAYRFGTVVAEVAVFGLIFGLLQPAFVAGSARVIDAGLIAQAAVCAGLLAWFASGFAQRVGSSTVRAALLVAGLASVAGATFWQPDAQVLAVATMALRVLVLTLMYVRLYAAWEVGGLGAAFVFGVGRGAYGAAELAGRFVHGLLAGQTALSLPTSVMGFSVACIFLLLLNSVLRRVLDTSTDSPRCAAAPVPTLDERLAGLAASRGLTPREAQVMRMLCDNRSAKGIAVELGISENTVLTHTKQVYRKMGVHGRQELLMQALDVEVAD